MRPSNPDVKFDKRTGLVTAVVQDYKRRDVLMVAYMNNEALAKTLSSGYTHYWSRSRKMLWKKGETSGNVQKVRRILVDCDRDALLILVDQKGMACHTGKRSCFFTNLRKRKRKTYPSQKVRSRSFRYHQSKDIDLKIRRSHGQFDKIMDVRKEKS